MKKVSVKLPVSIIKEGESYIAYTPALDLSTCANSYEKSKKRFGEAVAIFFEETMKKGTLEDALIDLGWKKVKSKWSPPVVVSQELQEVCVSVK